MGLNKETNSKENVKPSKVQVLRFGQYHLDLVVPRTETEEPV